MSVLYAIKQGPSPTCVQLARTRACLHKGTHECTLLHAQNITHTHTLAYTHNPLAVVRGVWLTNHELLCVCDLVALMLCQHWVLLAHFRTFFFFISPLVCRSTFLSHKSTSVLCPTEVSAGRISVFEHHFEWYDSWWKQGYPGPPWEDW